MYKVIIGRNNLVKKSFLRERERPSVSMSSSKKHNISVASAYFVVLFTIYTTWWRHSGLLSRKRNLTAVFFVCVFFSSYMRRPQRAIKSWMRYYHPMIFSNLLAQVLLWYIGCKHCHNVSLRPGSSAWSQVGKNKTIRLKKSIDQCIVSVAIH